MLSMRKHVQKRCLRCHLLRAQATLEDRVPSPWLPPLLIPATPRGIDLGLDPYQKAHLLIKYHILI
jgi:hypothetical protein